MMHRKSAIVALVLGLLAVAIRSPDVAAAQAAATTATLRDLELSVRLFRAALTIVDPRQTKTGTNADSPSSAVKEPVCAEYIRARVNRDADERLLSIANPARKSARANYDSDVSSTRLAASLLVTSGQLDQAATEKYVTILAISRAQLEKVSLNSPELGSAEGAQLQFLEESCLITPEVQAARDRVEMAVNAELSDLASRYSATVASIARNADVLALSEAQSQRRERVTQMKANIPGALEAEQRANTVRASVPTSMEVAESRRQLEGALTEAMKR